jgi:hypothetical protein
LVKYNLKEWNVINLVLRGCLKSFIVALYHDKLPYLNSRLALPPPACKPEPGRVPIRVGSGRKEFKFENIVIK